MAIKTFILFVMGAVVCLGGGCGQRHSLETSALEAKRGESARSILEAAQATIERRADVRFAYHAATTEHSIQSNEPEPIIPGNLVIDWHGNYLASVGRMKSEHHASWADRRNKTLTTNDRVYIFDGRQFAKLLKRDESDQTKEQDGYIEKVYHGEVHYCGAWLLNGEFSILSEQPPGILRRSIVEHMLALDDDRLSVSEVDSAGLEGTYRVNAQLDWGSCTLWIDPGLAHNIRKYLLIWESDLRPDQDVVFQNRWETRSVSYEKNDGQWIPSGCVLQWDLESKHWGYETVSQSETMISLRDIELLIAPEPDSTFEMDWPEGVEIEDRRWQWGDGTLSQ